MTVPRLWMNANVTSFEWTEEAIGHHEVSLAVSQEYLRESG